MNSLIKLYKFIDSLDDEKHKKYFETLKEEIKQKSFEESILKFEEEKKIKDKLKRLQKEREEEGIECPRCSRRDCYCN